MTDALDPTPWWHYALRRRLPASLISASSILDAYVPPPRSAWYSHSRRSARSTIDSFAICASCALPRESDNSMTSTYPTKEESVVIAAAEELMVKTMARYDPSHDAFHGQYPARVLTRPNVDVNCAPQSGA